MPIYQKLRKLRLMNNLSQSAIADELHISQNAYSLIETGKTRIDEQRIFQLAKILEIHPFEFFADDALNERHYHQAENEHFPYIQLLDENKELITQLSAQLAKKDAQIEELLQQVRQLFQMISIANKIIDKKTGQLY